MPCHHALAEALGVGIEEGGIGRGRQGDDCSVLCGNAAFGSVVELVKFAAFRGSLVGADEPLRLDAHRLRDDQHRGDARGGVGHGARGADRKGVVAWLARRSLGGRVERHVSHREFLDLGENPGEQPMRHALPQTASVTGCR